MAKKTKKAAAAKEVAVEQEVVEVMEQPTMVEEIIETPKPKTQAKPSWDTLFVQFMTVV